MVVDGFVFFGALLVFFFYIDEPTERRKISHHSTNTLKHSVEETGNFTTAGYQDRCTEHMQHGERHFEDTSTRTLRK